MQIISATDAKQSFGAALNTAQREPVLIRKQNQDVAVLMSVHEYEKLRGIRTKLFEALAATIAAKAAARGLTDADFEQLMSDVS